MTTTLTHDLRISGALAAGNIAQGVATITPVADTPTSEAITGLSLAGAGTTRAWCTPNTAFPGVPSGGRTVETSVSGIDETGFTLWVYRTNSTDTPVRWTTIRDRT